MPRPPFIENIYVIIGERIKAAREQAGLKQEEMGALMDPFMGKTSISGIECADRRVNLHHLMQIAQITGQPLSAFIPGLEDTRADALQATNDKLRNSIVAALRELQKGV